MSETTAENTAIALVIDKADIELETRASLKEAFVKFFDDAEVWRQRALTCRVTDATQVREMSLAREMRLSMRAIRVEAEKTRKRLKEDSIKKGRAIDGIYNALAYLIEPVEKYLSEQENFAEIAEAQRKQTIVEERSRLLLPWGVNLASYNLSEMDQADFDALLDRSKHAVEERKAEEKRREQERLEKERKAAEERARIMEENAKLRESQAQAQREAAEAKKKADAENAKLREAQAKAQREADAAKAESERIAREVREQALAESRRRAAEEKKRQDEERRRQEEERERLVAAEKEEARRKMAPDREKLAEYAKMVRELGLPELTSPEGKIVGPLLLKKRYEFAKLIEALLDSYQKWA